MSWCLDRKNHNYYTSLYAYRGQLFFAFIYMYTTIILFQYIETLCILSTVFFEMLTFTILGVIPVAYIY